MINLITVCTDAYPMEYARKTITRFMELTDLECTPYCITDRPDEIRDIATPIKPEIKTVGWWNKVLAYSPNMPKGFNVYLDIDIVLINNFDEEIRYAQRTGKKISCVSDAIMWKGNKFSSSMMMFCTGAMKDVYEYFKPVHKMLEHNYDGGDQVWTGHLLNDDDILYLDEVYPDIKMNLKFHLGTKVFGQWKFPHRISPKIKTVDCGGRPKPHDLQDLDYIRNNWHEIKT